MPTSSCQLTARSLFVITWRLCIAVDFSAKRGSTSVEVDASAGAKIMRRSAYDSGIDMTTLSANHDDARRASESGQVQDQRELKVLYGVFTNNKSEFRAKVVSQLQTWAKQPRSAGRYFAMTGYGDKPVEGSEHDHLWSSAIIAAPCNDAFSGLPCKEERLLELGADHDADWIFVSGEDNYVDVQNLEKRLASEITDAPIALGILGCGKGLVEFKFCAQLYDQGGFCGGGGYAINRAALKLFAGAGNQAAMRAKYATWSGLPNDMATSCMLLEKGVELRPMHELAANRFLKKTTLEGLISMQPLVYHYITPGVMHWIHARLGDAAPSVLTVLEKQAFEHGCCCWCDDAMKKSCLDGSSDNESPGMSLLRPGVGKAEFFQRCAVSLAAERNAKIVQLLADHRV